MKILKLSFIFVVFTSGGLLGCSCEINHDVEIARDIAHFDLDQEVTRARAMENPLNELSGESFINISLGRNCWIATNLQEFGLRIRSFPFDWNVTSFDGLCQLIENRFEGFLDIKNLCVKSGGPGLYNNRYDCWLAHDFNEEFWKNNEQGYAVITTQEEIEHYAKVCEYYERRIQRFYDIFTIDMPIYLFRREISSAEAQKLYVLFKEHFPRAQFTL